MTEGPELEGLGDIRDRLEPAHHTYKLCSHPSQEMDQQATCNSLALVGLEPEAVPLSDWAVVEEGEEEVGEEVHWNDGGKNGNGGDPSGESVSGACQSGGSWSGGGLGMSAEKSGDGSGDGVRTNHCCGAPGGGQSPSFHPSPVFSLRLNGWNNTLGVPTFHSE